MSSSATIYPVHIRICGCDDECRCMTEEAAIASAAAFLRETFQGRPCDAQAVSCCVRHNVLYLVKLAERAVEGRFQYVETNRG